MIVTIEKVLVKMHQTKAKKAGFRVLAGAGWIDKWTVTIDYREYNSF